MPDFICLEWPADAAHVAAPDNFPGAGPLVVTYNSRCDLATALILTAWARATTLVPRMEKGLQIISGWKGSQKALKRGEKKLLKLMDEHQRLLDIVVRLEAVL